MEENYFPYYLLKVIENDMKYMLQEKKRKFFFLNAISWQFIHSLFIHPLSCYEGLLLWNILWKKWTKKKKYTTSLKYIARILISRFLLQH